MRHSLRLVTLLLGMVVSFAAAMLQPSTSFAEELKGAGGGLQMLEQLNWSKEGADSITSTMAIVEFEPKYCIPPDEPNKLKEEQWLDGREQTLAKYVQRFRSLKLQFINLLKNDGTALKAVLGKLPEGANPIDDTFFQPWETSFKKAQNAIAAKRAELASIRVEDCSPPPPPPPQPIDWTAGLEPPSFGPPDFPPLPDHHCSWDEYWALIRAIHPYYNKSAEDAQIASRYRDKVGARLVRAKAAGASADVIAELQRMFDAVSQVAAERNKLSDQAAAHYEKAKRIPVVDCRTEQPQTAPDSQAMPQPSYEPVSPMQVPERFCSEAEKRAFLKAVADAKAAARRNYEKADAFAKELSARIKAGDRTPGLPKAQREASEAATKYYNLWIELDRVYYKAQAMPVVDCRQSGVAPGASAGAKAGAPAGVIPGAQAGAEAGAPSGVIPGASAGAQAGTREVGMGAAGDAGLGAHAAVAFGTQHLPTFVYLGFENAALVQTFAVENLDDDEQFTAFDGEVAIGVAPLLRYDSPSVAGFVAFGFNTFEVDGSTFRSEIDPLGQDLLLPFTTTPGISLGSGVPEGTPGGFNVVTDFQYRYNADQFSLYAKYGQRWECEDGALTGYAGLAYTNLDQHQLAAGDITGFASDFRYNTRIEVDTWRAVAGLRYERKLFDTPVGGLRGFVDVMGSVNFVDGEGRDAVDVSGFLNFAEAQDITKSDTTLGYSLGAGLVQHIDEAAMDIYIAYRHFGDETTPVVVRHDDGPSHLTYERSDYDVIIVGARVQF